jgi:hypothetical protein
MLDAPAYLLLGVCPKIGLIKRDLWELFGHSFGFADGLGIDLRGVAVDTMAHRTESGIELMVRR